MDDKKIYLLALMAACLVIFAIIVSVLDSRGINSIAGLLHMSRSTVLKYETGRQIPPVDRICDIADIFDVSTDYLYGVSDCSLPLSKLNEIFYDDMTYSELISIVLGLSEEHQKAFMIIVECLRKEQDCIDV